MMKKWHTHQSKQSLQLNEEIGMLGAATIDVSDLKGRLFMNMDSEDEGVFTVSCAEWSIRNL